MPIEELYNTSHFIHVDSPYEKKIVDSIYNVQRMGRREDIVTSAACREVEVATKNALDVSISKISNNETNLYVPFNPQLRGIGIFKIPFDSDKTLLDDGNLKMYYKRMLFMDVFKYYGASNEL